VLDLGAGRGIATASLKNDVVRDFLSLRGKVRSVTGADLDPVVKENPYLDEAVVVESDGPLPFPDASFDLIYSDWVLEHVENPDTFFKEIYRVLAPGGWFCARTPSNKAYFAIAARLLPAWLENRILSYVQPSRSLRDVYPKFYRINTLRAVARRLSSERWNLSAYYDDHLPMYHGGRQWLFSLLRVYQWLFPSVILIYAQKTASSSDVN
jgi:SAM-dependent methyltransferase